MYVSGLLYVGQPGPPDPQVSPRHVCPWPNTAGTWVQGLALAAPLARRPVPDIYCLP
jgi:hypothetical protein